MMDIVERLRSADRDSVQRMNGSRVFGEAADEIERLRDENESLRGSLEEWKLDLNSLRTENAKLRTDAARYRWLRAEQSKDLPLSSVVWKFFGHRPSGEWVNLIDGHDLDKHVDAAMREGK